MVYIGNRRTLKAITIATASINHEVTSYELWCCQRPNSKYIHVWRCTPYVIIPKDRRQKFDDCAVKCRFVEYMRTTKQYHCLELKNRSQYFTHDVVFHDSTAYHEKENEKLQRLWSSSSDDKKTCETELEQELKPIAVTLKPLATVARAAQKIKLRNLESNLGPM